MHNEKIGIGILAIVLVVVVYFAYKKMKPQTPQQVANQIESEIQQNTVSKNQIVSTGAPIVQTQGVTVISSAKAGEPMTTSNTVVLAQNQNESSQSFAGLVHTVNNLLHSQVMNGGILGR